MRNSAGQGCPSQRRLTPSRHGCLKLFLCVWALMATLTLANAAPILNTGSPVGFFTNVASRLLSSELNLDLMRIQIYPTNQYTPAVHRLLQVAANIYDASTNRYYDNSTPLTPLPTVFQPVFDVENGNVYITNFVEVTDTSIFTNTLRSLNGGSNVVAALKPNDLLFGVPLIIGAKKSFPNFNEFAMQNAFQLTRKLQVTRTSPTALPNTYSYNQMLILSITNQLGVECWNSYNSDYTRPVNILVTNYLSVMLTNDENFSISTNFILSVFIQIINLTNSVWSGYNFYTPNPSFQIPLFQSVTVIPNSIYRFNVGGTRYLTANSVLPYETDVVMNGINYPQPHWGMLVTNNIQAIMVDVASGRIIDYVQLSGPDSSRDLTSEILGEYDTGNPSQDQGDDLWDTNRNNQGLPYGYGNQVGVSLGQYPPGAGSGTWDQTDPTLLQNEIDGFRAYFHLSLLHPGNPGESQTVALAQATNAFQAPYKPMATVYQHVTWQANDPLVHYIASDLQGAPGNSLDRNFNWPANLGQLNDRYMPWGGNRNKPSSDQNPYNFAIKDPLVSSSDYWDFPTNKFPTVGWLGRVHRGTPWQTVFLKATNILAAANGLAVWENWTGDLDATDAAAMAPVQDWHMASLLASLLNTNDFRSLFSVNNPDPNTWLVLFNGLTALTNNLSDLQLRFGLITPQFGTLVISSNSPQALTIANAIQSVRASQPGRFFSDLGDILAIPQLTEQSPFLNWNDGVQVSKGISDEAYEIIPSQLLSLLRADSIGSIAPVNGQRVVKFTGYDGHAYAIEVSSDLINWVSISTNCPVNGMFGFTNSAAPNANQQFYRSVLLQ